MAAGAVTVIPPDGATGGWDAGVRQTVEHSGSESSMSLIASLRGAIEALDARR
jgi:hypothetical protein